MFNLLTGRLKSANEVISCCLALFLFLKSSMNNSSTCQMATPSSPTPWPGSPTMGVAAVERASYEVPPHRFVSDTLVEIGVDEETA